jgi:hypothetical protein
MWVYLAYHYTYLDWYVRGGASGFATEFTLRNLVKSIGALLGLAWVFVPFGAVSTRNLSLAEKRFLQYTIGSSLVCLAWGYVSSRLFYVMAPSFILLALLALRRFPAWAQYTAIAGIVTANIVWLVMVV